ncbi:serine/threonine protein kinase [Streptomyces sp. SAI-133]|uniref:serine/threonine-protein kinase n=1 Tax=unclassified Streptomyces TaxID=2593676 RepID=UPI0024743D2C|nr:MULTISPECIES: serine/threonine-protein kinase [unclassified Streptomyces]MDH6554212.1 serine/threonine protein kinase [Streptomyces sp. SAI-041]MDH6581790.1 serine/threonine protein kinase [Streptomyces sp. SAI-133]
MLLAERYRLEEPLGRGAMGEVWRADDQLLGRPVAVKLVQGAEAADSERFRMEAQTSARLNHPNVVSVYDFGSHDGQSYLVMELVDGWSLAQERSLRGALAPQEAAAVAAQMATGLVAAHQQGVIHRDIKPANVMLSADGTAKITDFGIARFADAAAVTLTATGKVMGTGDYLAPERALGRPATPASDVYSLGCVLYELLTGRPPFRGATTLAVVQQHVDASPPPPAHLRPDTPHALSDYVLRLLAKDPAHRPTAEQAADWLSGQDWTPAPAAPHPTAVPPPMPPPRRAAAGASHSRPRRHRNWAPKVLLGGAAIALFAAAAIVGATVNSGTDNTPAPTTPVSTTATSASPSATRSTAAPTITRAATTPAPDGNDDREDKDERGKSKHNKSDD